MTEQKLHSLLQRQIKKHLGDTSCLSPQCRNFLDVINATYASFDDDRSMLERSLDLSSQELMQANLESRALFQALPDLLFRVDADGKILSFKSGAIDDFLIHPQQLVGKRIQDVPIPRVARQFAEALERVRKENEVISLEYSLERQGEKSDYEARLVPLPERQTIIIIRNITAQKRIEEELRQSQKMEAFGQLAGGVAHDFNNLLTVLRVNIDLLQEPAGGDLDQHRANNDMIGAIDKAANLTRQLLMFSRRQTMQPQVLDLNEIVANMSRMLHRLIGEHIALEACYASGHALVNADAGMLEQVIMNLAINARDAMPKGGQLVIRTSVVIISEAQAALNPNSSPGPHACLSVSDTGTGIDPSNLPHIFEPFYTTKEVGKGTGLGLATVFGIIDQHHGWIEVETQLGVGTTMRAFLPTIPSTSAVAAPLEPPPVPQAGVGTILLVEDEIPVRRVIRRLLERHGYRVFEAGSGDAALELWAENKDSIDLLFTDMIMPGGMNGREIIDRLRQERPTLKVVFCSGYTDDVLGNDSWLRNEVNFLGKPFIPEVLLQTVSDTLKARVSKSE